MWKTSSCCFEHYCSFCVCCNANDARMATSSCCWLVGASQEQNDLPSKQEINWHGENVRLNEVRHNGNSVWLFGFIIRPKSDKCKWSASISPANILGKAYSLMRGRVHTGTAVSSLVMFLSVWYKFTHKHTHSSSLYDTNTLPSQPISLSPNLISHNMLPEDTHSSLLVVSCHLPLAGIQRLILPGSHGGPFRSIHTKSNNAG